MNDVFNNQTVDVDENTFSNITGLGYEGLRYACYENTKFIEFSSFLKNKVKLEQTKQLACRSSEIIEAMKTSPDNLNTLLNHARSGEGGFSNISILQYIDAEKFFSGYLSLKNEQKRYVTNVLSNRYDGISFNHTLAEERDWLVDFTVQLNNYISDLGIKPSKIVMQYTHDTIFEITENLKN